MTPKHQDDFTLKAYELVPSEFVKALALPFMLGEAKYGKDSWKTVDHDTFLSRRARSLKRHLKVFEDKLLSLEHDNLLRPFNRQRYMALELRNVLDDEGPHHLAAVAWNALAMLWHMDKVSGIIEVSKVHTERTIGKYKNLLKFKDTVPPVNDTIYYLASPYSHLDPAIKKGRYETICKIAADLYNKGYNLIEPIASSHPTAEKHNLPTGYEFWKKRDRKMIDVSYGVIVAMMPGWKESVGVTDEVEYAKSQAKPVYYLEVPDGF
jgi:hypothetical protein